MSQSSATVKSRVGSRRVVHPCCSTPDVDDLPDLDKDHPFYSDAAIERWNKIKEAAIKEEFELHHQTREDLCQKKSRRKKDQKSQ